MNKPLSNKLSGKTGSHPLSATTNQVDTFGTVEASFAPTHFECWPPRVRLERRKHGIHRDQENLIRNRRWSDTKPGDENQVGQCVDQCSLTDTNQVSRTAPHLPTAWDLTALKQYADPVHESAGD